MPSSNSTVPSRRSWAHYDKAAVGPVLVVVRNEIEGACVLAGAVADHEPDGLLVAYEQVSGGLGGPGAGGVGGDPGEVDTACFDVDEQENLEAAQRVGIDAEEAVATKAWAWLAMNSLQLGPVRLGVGARPVSRRIFHTVDAAMRCPRRRISPWMRRYLHGGFSVSRRNCSDASARSGRTGRLGKVAVVRVRPVWAEAGCRFAVCGWVWLGRNIHAYDMVEYPKLKEIVDDRRRASSRFDWSD